jgi:hypothetical protein
LSFLSFGKLRASYGTSGNDQFADYQYLSTYTPNPYTYEGMVYLTPTNLQNPLFSWEEVKKTEAGLELGFLKDRIAFTASFYRNRSSNQLVGYALPTLTGFSTVAANLPALVQNTGAEFILYTSNIKSARFSWTSSINLTIPKNKLIAYPNIAGSSYANTYEVGKSLFIQKFYRSAGVNDTTGVYQYISSQGAPTSSPSYPQDISATQPLTQQWFGGFENSFRFKGFQLDFLFQFVNQERYNYFAYNPYYLAGQFDVNFPTAVLGRWQKPGDVSQYGRFSTQYASDPTGSSPTSSFVISNTSFIRFKNLSFSYNLPKAWIQSIHFQSARLYVQCQNLFTISHALGQDPETGSSNLPPLRMITGGFQIVL